MDSSDAAAVFARVIEDVHESNFASLELVVWHDAVQAAPSDASSAAPTLSPVRRKIAGLFDGTRRQQLAFSRYTRFDERGAVVPRPGDPVDCARWLDAVPSLSVRPEGKRFVHRFPAADVERIKDFGLDVLLRFGFNILRGGLLEAARYGVWSYHHGDNDAYRGGPPLFWEMVEGNPESGVILQVLTEALDDGLVLRKSVFPTAQGQSWSANTFGPYWGSQHFVIEQLWLLHNFGWEHLTARARRSGTYRGRRAIYRAPTNTELARWLVPAMTARVVRRVARVFRTKERHWRVGLRRLPGEDSAIGRPLDLSTFTWIDSPRGVFWADPMLFERDGRTYLFIEELDYAAWKGRVRVAQVEDPAHLRFETCLEEPFHLSYPLVFSSGDEIYMIPETYYAGEVRLYVAEAFPLRWTFHKTLLRLPAVDATPFFDGRKWWLFVTTCEPAPLCPSLLLFHADAPQGPWHYHPGNPIASHLDTVRNAGPIVTADGRRFRPGQSARGGYGTSFSLNEIVCLTETDYEERSVITVPPHGVRGLVGTHTYGRSSQWEVVDGFFEVPAGTTR
jgi:hypothetical protein